MKSVLYLVHWVLVGLGAATLLLAAFAFTPGGRHLADDLLHNAGTASYARAVNGAASAVVRIETSARAPATNNRLTNDPLFRDFFGATGDTARRARSLGSGVILGRDGVIVTSHHVVAGAESIHVTLSDGRSARARLVGTDPDTDLAVLRVALQQLPTVALGDSDALRVGDVVLAIGNPLGIGQTVTQGIVSATGRNRVGINTFENFIQTDAAINLGNSGGALVDARGELVGINAVRLDTDGIGFAIPASIVADVVRQILDTGRVRRGWIGVDARDLTPTLRTDLGIDGGILVLGVMPGGPADQAGLRRGDVLTRFDGRHISDSRTALDLIAAASPGDAVELQLHRDGATAHSTVRISERPARAVAQPN